MRALDLYKSIVDDLLLKAKRYNVGEISHRKDGPYKKIKKSPPKNWIKVIKVGNKYVDPGKIKGKITTPGYDIGKKAKKSIESPYYYQVNQGKGLWKKYKTFQAYREDFPKGPKKGHILVNHNHDAHLRINRNTYFAQVGKKKYKSQAEFLKAHPIPSKDEIKAHVKKSRKYSEKKGIKANVKPDFHHPDWHPSKEGRLNADEKAYLGVLAGYKKYRKNYDINVKHKEGYARAGKLKSWSIKKYHEDRFFEGEKREAEARERRKKGVVKVGSPVIFKYRGKELRGKVVATYSIGKDGKPIKKKKTHYDIKYDSPQNIASLKKVKKKIAKMVKAEHVDREQYARKVKSKEQQSEEYAAKVEKSAEKALGKLMKKLKAKNEYELQAKIGEKLGDLSDPKNPFRRIVAVKVAGEIARASKMGFKPTSDMSFNEIVFSGFTGVIEAMADWDEKRSSLQTFLQSDQVYPYVREHIRDAIGIEIRSFADIKSYDVKLAIMNMRHIVNNMKAENNGKMPSVDKVKKRYLDWFGNKKGLNLSKVIMMATNRRVTGMIDDLEQGGKMDIIESVMSHYKSPEQHYFEKETMKDFHQALDSLVSQSEALAMKLKYRVDETTTGSGVKGERSPYYDKEEKEDVSASEGKVTMPGWSKTDAYNYRTDKEVARIMNGIGLKIQPKEVKNKIKSGRETILEKYEEGDKNAKKLRDIWLNKSLENFTKMLLLKSQPEMTWIIEQQKPIIQLVTAIFSEKMAA